ncbi:Sir2 family NAD+-dependent deacetylase [Photobacterium sanguinicancri]|uniref:NAD-dependent protein deacylase n=1 Tax=Photobacterium sanguinicancri TaxID=875932 RepID=A0AAW7Y7F6_9GAMM|nr:Sir2 family NAD+-dependent deacetylase [Photobacterium sanguinicancri]MDO6543434.1 NAD-dependent protein deacylase [Photobacterium sanguinicancri]
MLFPYQNIVVLTGAGISAESGIRTFRDQDGLWESHRIEDVATPEGYKRDPVMVQNFYNLRRQQLESGTVSPNAAHLALAELEAKLDGKVTIVTQNIDNLHEAAGSKNIIHMHGELLKAQCSQTGQSIDWTGNITLDDHCHCCQIPAPMRPNVVWFGEMPIGMGAIHEALLEADLFISVGTSGAVYPAAGFVHEAAMHGAHTVELNLEPSDVESEFAEKRYGPASELVPKFVAELLED